MPLSKGATVFKPGDGYEYSNTNYLLLGLVIQKVAGVPYCQFLHTHIFAPLSMSDTRCAEETEAREHQAFGYAPLDPGDGKPLADSRPLAELAHPSFLFGAANLVSTGDDLVRWTTALHHGRVLSPAAYREMTTPVRSGYGYGLQIGALRGHIRLDHSGSVPGFYSELEYFPATDDTVVILSNQNAIPTSQFTPGTLALNSELMTLAADWKAHVPSEGKEVLTSTRVLRLMEGRYLADDGSEPPVIISLHGDHLQVARETKGQPPSELHGDYDELDFYFTDKEAALEFSGQNELVIFDTRHGRANLFHRVGPESRITGH